MSFDRVRKWRLEFPYTLDRGSEELRREVPDLKREEMEELLARGCLDHVVVDGEVRLLRRFVPNAFWLCPELRRRRRWGRDERLEAARLALRRRAEKVSRQRAAGGDHVLPLRYRVRAELGIEPGAMSEGEVVRIWIPLPRPGRAWAPLSRELTLLHGCGDTPL